MKLDVQKYINSKKAGSILTEGLELGNLVLTTVAPVN
jgi:hypothetical protein